jgi:hypothetical protein
MGGHKGIAFFYKHLSRLLPVTIVSTKNNEPPAELDAMFLKVLSNSRLRYINPLLFFKVRKIIKENSCTHLILEHPYYGWLGILLKWACNIRLVVHSHNIESMRFKSTGKWWWRILWQYEKKIYRQANIKFFVTDDDRNFAIKHFALDATTCHTITYGFEKNKMPSLQEKKEARNTLEAFHSINTSEKILLFNGTLDYKPNRDAVDAILHHINPLLRSDTSFKYKIIICGKGLPTVYNELKDHATNNIIYAGFVEDINIYFTGADIFINPVTDGGGIKTKLVEALGANLSCISSKSGATGVPLSVTGNKLFTIDDNNWLSFAEAIKNIDLSENIPDAFFEHFYWGNIAAKATLALT